MSPRHFIAEIKRRNVYKVAITYAVVAWLIIQIATQIFPIFEIPTWAPRLVVLLLVLGFPVALVLAWAFELTPEGIKRTEGIPTDQRRGFLAGSKWIWCTIVLGALAVSFFVGQRFVRNAQPTPVASPTQIADKSIAVLPFVDLSQAKDQEYFCDGISEEILDGLAKVEGLRVVARTSSFSFKGKSVDVSDVAHKLNVQNVLEGSLRREGNRIRITAQLINAKDGFHLWSETYERELQGVFAVQDEITRAIVDALKVKLAVALPAREKRNPEAYDLYLQGVYFSNKSTEEGLRKSLEFFQRSLEKDPNSARAWAGVAKVWNWLADAYVKPMDAYPAMKAAALKAVSLDEREPEGHVYLGESKRVLDWDLGGAEAEHRRALQLDPHSTAHLYLALGENSRGNLEQGELHRRAAINDDPLSPIVGNFSAALLISNGRLDEAIAEAKRTLALDPNYLYQNSILAEAYREKGMMSEAIELFKKGQEMTGNPPSGLAVAYAKIGRLTEAQHILDELLQLAATKYVPGEEIANVYAALGQDDEAFRWLDRAYAEHSGSLHSVAIRPTFRRLRSDPRFPDLLKRLGFEPAKVLARDKTQ